MVYIDAVHYEQDIYGNEYIARMKWTNDLTTQATSECYGHWTAGEDVRVVDNRYLRTDANNIKADNLGSLPRY